ncbi:uncharacterized protein XM38_038100 [Halomicronema hongdechloris C2206]|uniref:Uncharacterized protein n=1 Tax=Halomicronema hongdechloris C2206 TaxID=1641165 RepID=A0A1Z3HRA7_9CYAN|nr:hypothetical protein [Halomicronema hongdechloris]ASC72850.1 uncharacterized protein XM38_038100 [Halomicronema hongdechloris C2206]
MSEPILPPEPNSPESQPTSPAWPPTPDDQWETVNFPHTKQVDDIPGAPAPTASNQAAPQPGTDSSGTGSSGTGSSGAELLQLIRDLNQCNEVLLARVAELEEALERSQTALQAEVERAHRDEGAAQGRQYAIAHNQQIAQLVSELDSSQDALKRQQICNDTQQAEIDTQKGRIAQLERECTLLRQHYTEKANALEQANASTRDLQARLQRQQRYTLQFKAALEKCLDMSSARTESSAPAPGLLPDPLAMPRSQRIQPWSSQGTATPPLDPALDSLLRADPPSRQTTETPQTSPNRQDRQDRQSTSPATASDSGDSPQEDGLWQDLERVIETSIDSPSPPSATKEPTFSEPSPWGQPMSPAASSTAETPVPAAEELSQRLPTGEAPMETISTSTQSAPETKSTPTGTAPALSDLPILTTATDTSPAPIVYPLRPKKKAKNLAAIDLPRFPRLPQS